MTVPIAILIYVTSDGRVVLVKRQMEGQKRICDREEINRTIILSIRIGLGNAKESCVVHFEGVGLLVE